MGKSPLTGGWGDANAGGYFGPSLKFAGYDGVFINGASEKPVYLYIENGKAELKDAAHLWGKSTFETDDTLQAECGKTVRVLSIGPAGEQRSFVACLMNYGGDAAGRSGLGAVMGSKMLKALVVRGDMKVAVADSDAVNRLRQVHMAEIKGPGLEGFHRYGTNVHTDISAHSGDTPVKNWGGVGVIDLPDVSGLNKDAIDASVASRMGCWRCPAACKGRLKEGTGEYRYPAGTHRPEYETSAAFGAMCLNNNADAIAMATHICNNYGLDTISTGTIIAFAMECFENGLITRNDTDGIELTWGNHQALMEMLRKIGEREGFGGLLGEGVKMAAERIGGTASNYAMHVKGLEFPAHEPRALASHALG
ncbi:hypothetical protein ES703_122490 [subsurface metagenome]